MEDVLADLTMYMRRLRVFNHLVNMNQMTLRLCFFDKQKKLLNMDLSVNTKPILIRVGNFLAIWTPRCFGPSFYHIDARVLNTYKKRERGEPIVSAKINKDLSHYDSEGVYPIKDWRLWYKISHEWGAMELPKRSLRKSEIRRITRLVESSIKNKHQDKKEVLEIFLNQIA